MKPVKKGRLSPHVRPERVRVHVDVDPSRKTTFRGEVSIDLRLAQVEDSIQLHAADLRVTHPRIRIGDTSHECRIIAAPRREMIEVIPKLPIQLPRGEATLELRFSGRLRKDLCGLYGVQVGDQRYAFTQLEAADARKFFPCFDEPAMKARFELSVTTGAHNRVLSNAPAARTRRHGDGRKTVDFEPTPPLSTYLIALAVGELVASRPVCVGPTRIRVWHTKGKGRLTGFALEAARECLIRLERYFGVPYPYAKLDLVAVPDFEFGAMENAGAVFFRETLLLLDPGTATLPERKRAAEVICHELAHMWYGDLVTMAWWDDLWLNESFATWMAYAIVDDWRPDWRMWHDFQHGRNAALEFDAQRHTHPIYCRVDTPAQASENFDLITYEKGAAVVRMIERYLGPAAFRRGVRTYIRRHREGNAVASDLWKALSEASGEDVGSVARAWVEREGYPVVELKRRRERGRTVIELRQQRFTEQTPRRPSRVRWPIPWVAKIGSGPRGRTRLERRLLTKTRERISLAGPEPRFVYGNADEAGFFRPLHGDEDFRALTAAPQLLSAAERMGLVDHQWALVRARRSPLSTFLDLAEALRLETDPDVLLALCRPLRFLAGSLIPDAAPRCEEAFRDWLAALFQPRFEELGWAAGRDEPDEVRLRRAALLTLAGSIAGVESLVAAAAERCPRYLANRRSLDANLADGVVSLAARGGGASLHRSFLRAMREARTPQDQRRFLLALADFRDPKLVERTLGLSLTDAVPTQDVIFLLARLLENPSARGPGWDFIRKRWPRLRKRMPSLLASRLISATPALLTPERRREVAAFFRANPVPSGNRALRQALLRFDWYRGFRVAAARELTKHFGREHR